MKVTERVWSVPGVQDRARGRCVGEGSGDTSATPPTVQDDVASSWVAESAVP